MYKVIQQTDHEGHLIKKYTVYCYGYDNSTHVNRIYHVSSNIDEEGLAQILKGCDLVVLKQDKPVIIATHPEPQAVLPGGTYGNSTKETYH